MEIFMITSNQCNENANFPLDKTWSNIPFLIFMHFVSSVYIQHCYSNHENYNYIQMHIYHQKTYFLNKPEFNMMNNKIEKSRYIDCNKLRVTFSEIQNIARIDND
ncbi:hypothetical protein DERP_007597 [Dermatophagoides pteronyssinus]|uniref:Uncharacterized protein n=1 Tax=Dermatophagoides pteronyssinus TaxID=6956 RepID=A0ABQ8JK72_DERPT|nr:hypothetical protein DERP_007597 [Dermatophagoides pteronyssinus]